MQVIHLTKDQVTTLYETSLRKDFPADERKPLAMMLQGMDNGTYECLGAVLEDEIVGYAFFVKNGNDYLFDYLAVIEAHRNSGIGAAFLKELAEHYAFANSVIGEVEDPAFAKSEEDRALQTRRLNFYLRNGYIDTGVRTKTFGVPFIILEMGIGNPARKHTKEEVTQLYKMQYKAFLPWWLYLTNIKIKRN